jgi:hypothetical protein
VYFKSSGTFIGSGCSKSTHNYMAVTSHNFFLLAGNCCTWGKQITAAVPATLGGVRTGQAAKGAHGSLLPLDDHADKTTSALMCTLGVRPVELLTAKHAQKPGADYLWAVHLFQ